MEWPLSAGVNPRPLWGALKLFFKIWNIFHKKSSIQKLYSADIPHKGKTFEVLNSYERVIFIWCQINGSIWSIRTHFAFKKPAIICVSCQNSERRNSLLLQRIKVAMKVTEGSGFFFFFCNVRGNRIKVLMLLILDFQLLVTHYK